MLRSGWYSQVESVDPLSPAFCGDVVVPRLLHALQPHVVVVTTPPAPGLVHARAAARIGAIVLLEKPGSVTPVQFVEEDQRIYLAHEAHLEEQVVGLLTMPAEITRAELRVRCWRGQDYYRGWRTQKQAGGGVLHQQARQGLGLLARLDASWGEGAAVVHGEQHPDYDVDIGVIAHLAAPDGRRVTVDVRVDDPYAHRQPCQQLQLHTRRGHVTVHRPLSAGLGHPRLVSDQQRHRHRLHDAIATVAAGGPSPAGVFPLRNAGVLFTLMDRLGRGDTTTPLDAEVAASPK